jgi:hypothetical protein
MNVVFHALAGGAIAHVVYRFAAGRNVAPTKVTLGGAALAAVASHGLLDWLRHGYPVPSRLDVVLALVASAGWLALVQPRLRLLFAMALAGSFLPDLVDHLPRLLHFATPLPVPTFPWHASEWSGSLYPVREIRAGSHLVALEAGSNRVASILNHTLVASAGVVCIFLGRAAFGRKVR